MIQEIVLFATLVCSPVQVDNRVELVDHITTVQDVDVLTNARKRCGEIYKDSPCVTKFIIKLDDWGDRMYSVACGQKIWKQPNMRLK